MADHDLLAELAGYRNELAYAELHGRGDPAAIRKEIKRVSEAVKADAAGLADEAKELKADGQDVAAEEKAAEGRRLLAALDAGPEDASDKTPRERAASRRKS